ncbi:MAG: tetratricopeptide repeat protein [SAR324 cluster bacterium]
MKKVKVSGAEVSLYTMLIICLLSFLFVDKLGAQESIGNSDQAQSEDPSPVKAAASAEKKKSLEELLAVPFNQIKQEQEEEALTGDGNGSEGQSTAKKGDVRLPPPPEQRKVERDIEKQLDVIFREKLPKEFVGVSVSIRYILETVPVTKRDKSISKIKLPGFENNVWVPTQTKKIVGIVNQVRPYTTIFAVVNTPVSLFNVEVLRQTLDDRVKFLNLTGRDVLKMVHVPFTTPANSSVTTLDNAAVELADADNDNSSINDEEPGVKGQRNNLSATDNNLGAVLEPNPELRSIDMKARVETTRYLLQARKAYMNENYDSAITALRRAIEINPFSSQAFAMLGSIYYRLGWNRMALENWQHALELDPTNEGLKKYLLRLSR